MSRQFSKPIVFLFYPQKAILPDPLWQQQARPRVQGREIITGPYPARHHLPLAGTLTKVYPGQGANLRNGSDADSAAQVRKPKSIQHDQRGDCKTGESCVHIGLILQLGHILEHL